MAFFAAYLKSTGAILLAAVSSYIFSVALFLALFASLPLSGTMVANFVSWLILELPIIYLWSVVVPVSICCLLVIPLWSKFQPSSLMRRRMKAGIHAVMVFAIGGALMHALSGSAIEVLMITILPAICATIFCVEAALLHKAGCERSSPFPGQTYATGSVTGIPRACVTVQHRDRDLVFRDLPVKIS